MLASQFDERLTLHWARANIHTLLFMAEKYSGVDPELLDIKENMTQELRTLYVDSACCDNDSRGGLSLRLSEAIEVPGQDLAAYCDDSTIA